MGKCSNCGKKIEYNSYKMYRGKILCIPCYKTRLPRKKARKVATKSRAKTLPGSDPALVDSVTPAIIKNVFDDDEDKKSDSND